MQIQVKNRQVPAGQKLSPGEKLDLVQKKQELETQLNDKDSAHMIQDPANLRESLKRVNTRLAADEDVKAVGPEKDRVVARIKQIDEMVRREIDPIVTKQIKPGTDEYEKAVEAGMKATDPVVTNLIEERKRLKRCLESDNPDAGSIETIVKGETKI